MNGDEVLVPVIARDGILYVPDELYVSRLNAANERAEKAEAACAALLAMYNEAPTADRLVEEFRIFASKPNPGQPLLDEIARLRNELATHPKATKDGENNG